MNRTEIALAYASVGWHVFPLAKGGKTPAVSQGFKSATREPARIRRWWDTNPEWNIGVATGASKLIVIDIDPDNGGLDTLWHLIRAGFDFPPTPSQVTASGGAHYFYRSPDHQLRNKAGRLPGVPHETPGIDVRAQGGYVVVPPSSTEKGKYEWLQSWEMEPAPAPAWLRPTPAQRPLPVVVGDVHDGYVEAALRGECEKVSRAAPGTRNHQLNESAFRLGTLIATGVLTPETVVSNLLAASHQAGLGEREIRNTIKSGLNAGLARPRSVS